MAMIKSATAEINSVKRDFPPRRRNADGQRRKQPRFDELRQQLLPHAHAHQKNAASAGGITSSSQRICGCSNLIFKS